MSPKDREYIIERTAGIAAAFKQARLFVTGGTGVIGTWILESLCALNQYHSLGLTTVVLTRSPETFFQRRAQIAVNPSISVLSGDVRSFQPPSEAFDFIIHAATDSSGAQQSQSRLHMFETIVDGSRRVLDFANAARPKSMLYVSSNAVYGRSFSGSDKIEEDTPNGPRVTDSNVEYDESKRMAESLCILYHREYGLPTKIARCFPVVGPHLPLDQHFAVGNFIRDALAGGPIRVNGDGTPVRSYMHLADVAIWLLTVLVQGQPAHPYNVGSEEPITIADLAKMVAGHFDPAPIVTISASPIGDVSRYVPSTKRARTELGLGTIYGLEKAILSTIDFHRTTIS